MQHFSIKTSTGDPIPRLTSELSTKISDSALASKLIFVCISRDPEVVSQIIQLVDLFKYPEDISSLKTEGDVQESVAIIQRNPRLFESLVTSLLRNFVESAYFELKKLELGEFEVSGASQNTANDASADHREQFEQAVINFALCKLYLVTQSVPTESLEIFRINLEHMLRTRVQDRLAKRGFKLEETPLTPYQTPWLISLKEKFKTELSRIKLFETSEESFINLVSELLAFFTARHAESLSKLASEENPQEQKETIVGFVVQQFVSLQTNLDELLKAELPDPFPCSTA